MNSQSGTAAAGEDRRLKALGLLLLALAVACFSWLDANRPAGWPPRGDLIAAFMLACTVGANLLVLGTAVLSAGFGGGRSLRDPLARKALVLKLVAANVLVPGLVYGLLDDGEARASFEGSPWFLPIGLAIFALAIYGLAALRRGWRHEALRANELMAQDARAPVLYLRSFKDDSQALLEDHGMPLFAKIVGAFSWRSPEQELALLLGRVGPVVAIGKPGEPLPELGAARMYVAHDEWQQRVSELMGRAALVVLRVGASPGVVWEIEQALARIPRQRLVLVLLGDGAIAPEIAQRLAPVLGADFALALPVPHKRYWLGLVFSNPRRRLGAVVCFGTDGTPRVEAVRQLPSDWLEGRAWLDLLPMLVMRPSAGPLRMAFRRVYAHLGLPFDAPAQQRSRAVAIWLALLIGGTGAHCFYLGRRRLGWLHLLLLPVAISIFWAWFEGLRMIWMNRDDFERLASRVNIQR